MNIDEAIHFRHGNQLGFQEYFQEKKLSGITIEDFNKFIDYNGTNVFG